MSSSTSTTMLLLRRAAAVRGCCLPGRSLLSSLYRHSHQFRSLSVVSAASVSRYSYDRHSQLYNNGASVHCRSYSTLRTDNVSSSSSISASEKNPIDDKPPKDNNTSDTAAPIDYLSLRAARVNEIAGLPENRASLLLEQFLREKSGLTILKTPTIPSTFPNVDTSRTIAPPTAPVGGYRHELTLDQMAWTVDAALMTFCLHVESRIASLIGKGFYTIGPCGEEALSSAGLVFEPHDSVALHYRHLGINLTRQIKSFHASKEHITHSEYDAFLQSLVLERARGYTVSRLDPITGGAHCSIGTTPSRDEQGNIQLGGDFVVTSTLASQCPAAVGRALGYSLLQNANAATEATSKSGYRSSSTKRPVSFVTLGDGSVHNHHFWSAFHLARHARHRRVKCPVVFGISDNGLSISYQTKGYVSSLFQNGIGTDPLVPVFSADGNDMLQVYDQTYQALEYARKQSAPAVLIYRNLVRRFGHAATDRQAAYLDLEDIQARADMTVLESTMAQAVEVYGAISYPELLERYAFFQDAVQSAFAQAAAEPKVTRQDMLDRLSQPLAVPTAASTTTTKAQGDEKPKPPEKLQVMRKHMTRVLDEALEQDPHVVYLGEDVEHGGYYVVTEGLAAKYPGRVIDFPPDETSLLGAAMGFAQDGLVPIIEIPYSKYLDCGADAFYEIAISNWLTNGQRPNGMIIRLQGFDRGLFGGNFHTDNQLQHIPPGIDVVCYSNGEDYVRGFRHALLQAKAGRVVMFVDCTNLLNLRHLFEKDRAWERKYPTLGTGAEDGGELMGFDDIKMYGTSGSHAIVTYGNGVVTALRARRAMVEQNTGIIPDENAIDIIDCPYLSDVPESLRTVVGNYKSVLFADICKDGPGSNILSSTAISLHRDGLLPPVWDLVAAPRTYNPLGNMCTFLNEEDIIDMAKKVIARSS